jgi:hypothetical protein
MMPKWQLPFYVVAKVLVMVFDMVIGVFVCIGAQLPVMRIDMVYTPEEKYLWICNNAIQITKEAINGRQGYITWNVIVNVDGMPKWYQGKTIDEAVNKAMEDTR